MTEREETRQLEPGGSPENTAEGGTSTSIVAQVQRRREAALRCEPLDCGHRDPLDCETACRSDEPAAPVDEPPHIEPGDAVQLWAAAKTLFLADDFPPYASPEWRALHPDDPKRLAGALDAAEKWRKYGDEDALVEWLRSLAHGPYALWRTKTLAELDALAKPHPPHIVQAAPGWPPVAIPGKPGRWRHHIDGRQVDLPHNRTRTYTHQEAA